MQAEGLEIDILEAPEGMETVQAEDHSKTRDLFQGEFHNCFRRHPRFLPIGYLQLAKTSTKEKHCLHLMPCVAMIVKARTGLTMPCAILEVGGFGAT